MTLTSEDLRAIGNLLEPIHRRLESVATKQDLIPFATKQDIKKIVSQNNSIIGTIFKVELVSTAKEIIKAIMGLNQKMQHQEKRIDRLERHVRAEN